MWPWPENGGKRRGEGERVERGNGNRKRDRERKLPKQDAGGAGKERYRNENRNEHERSGDDGAGYFLHRDRRGIVRLGNSFGHVALHAFDHHDGVVDDKAGGKRETEERESVDRKAENLHERKCPDQGNRNRNRGNECAAPVLQKDENYEDYENDCFEQRVQHVLDGFADYGRRVECDGVLDAREETASKGARVRPSRPYRPPETCARQLRDAEADCIVAVEAKIAAVVFGSQLGAAHITQATRLPSAPVFKMRFSNSAGSTRRPTARTLIW